MYFSSNRYAAPWGKYLWHTFRHSFVQQNVYWVPNMCQVPFCYRYHWEKWQRHIKSFSQWVINIQCYSGGLSELLGASFSPLADCVVIFDLLKFLLHIWYRFSTIHFLNTLSFLLSSFFKKLFFPLDHLLTSQQLFLSLWLGFRLLALPTA